MEPPPLKIDPKCIDDALRAFLQPIKNDDARLDFYTVYKKESTEYDADYVKKYEEDLNTTLIFAGLFSAVSSAFVLDVQSKLEPDPNEQSAALLRAILFTLNQSAIPDESPTAPPVHESPSGEIVAASCLMYASLLISLLAAFIAMLGKQWLNRYLRNTGGSTIERCGDRQRKLEGLERWPFHTFVESLPVMLQISLLLLACGLARHMAPINTSVASVLITFIVVGIVFYLGIVVAGTSSYECPFQTPASTALRDLWKKIGPRITLAVPPIVNAFRSLWGDILLQILRIVNALRSLWDVTLCQILCIALRLPVRLNIWRRFRRSHPLNAEEDLSIPWLADLCKLWKDVQSRILQVTLRLPLALKLRLRDRFRSPPLPTTQEGPSVSQEITPWLTTKDLVPYLRNNANDVRCVSWILRNITDPEAIDAAVRLAGTVRWFEDGINVEPPYDTIVSIFEACFDSTKKVYPVLKDRAYFSLRTILWISALAKCKSPEFSQKFPLPPSKLDTTTPDQDGLMHLISVCHHSNNPDFTTPLFSALYNIPHEASYMHAQWTSNLLLHLSWTEQDNPKVFQFFGEFKATYHYDDWDAIPLDAILNRFLVWCIFLGSPIEEEVLRIQDKSDRLERISTQLSQAITTAITAPTRPDCDESLLPEILHSLTTWKSRPGSFITMAYEWCSVICGAYPELEDGRGRELLFLSLEIGFRHLNSLDRKVEARLTHTEHHHKMADTIFKNGDGELIADLLHAWIPQSRYHHTHLHICARYIVDIQRLQPISPRLRCLLILSIGLIGYQEFEQIGGNGLFELLNHLHVRAEDVSSGDLWVELLLNVIRSTEGIRRLPYSYWELLVEFAVSKPKRLRYTPYDPHIMESLEEAEEWDRLECWIGIVWAMWGPDCRVHWRAANLEPATLSLFRKKTGAYQKLERWMERIGERVLEPFQQMCERENFNAVRQRAPLISSTDGEPGEPVRSLPPAVPPPFVGDDTF